MDRRTAAAANLTVAGINVGNVAPATITVAEIQEVAMRASRSLKPSLRYACIRSSANA